MTLNADLIFDYFQSWTPVAIALFTLLGFGVAVSLLTDLVSPTVGPPEYKGGWPLIGHIMTLMPYSISFRTHVFLSKVLEETGPIALVRIALRKLVLVGDANAAKSILTNGDEFCRRGPFLQKRFMDISENALFVLPSGDLWKKHRKLLQPAFGPAHLKHVFEATLAELEIIFNDIWSEYVRTNESFNIHHHMSCLTADVIGRVAFSYDLQLVKRLLDKDAEKLQNIRRLENILIYVSRHFLPPIIRYIYNIEPGSIKESMEELARLFQDIIDHKNESEQKDKRNLDVLDRLLKGIQQGHAEAADFTFTQQELMDEMFAFFLAGHETTANTITFAVLELCRNPEAFRKLREESDKVWKECGGALSYEAISNLKYADAVVKEALRLHPVVSGILRTTAKDVILSGHLVKKDTDVSVSIRFLHRNELYWKDSMSFQPERWLEEGFYPVSGSYLPFGDGAMNCIGQKMAVIEARVVLSQLAHQFDLELLPDQELEPITTITTGLKSGLFVKVCKRK